MPARQEAQLAARIRSRRKALGWSQEELARQAGVAEGTVARLERGDNVRPGNLFSIRTALGMEDDEQERPESENVALALDVVRKYLSASDDPDKAALELTRWVVSQM